MGRTRGPGREEYPIGTIVRIADRAGLEHVMQTWKYHHKLQPEQLAYAGRTAVVRDYGFYHGGDELYWLEGIPGTWHEQCLSGASDADERPPES